MRLGMLSFTLTSKGKVQHILRTQIKIRNRAKHIARHDQNKSSQRNFPMATLAPENPPGTCCGPRSNILKVAAGFDQEFTFSVREFLGQQKKAGLPNVTLRITDRDSLTRQLFTHARAVLKREALPGSVAIDPTVEPVVLVEGAPPEPEVEQPAWRWASRQAPTLADFPRYVEIFDGVRKTKHTLDGLQVAVLNRWKARKEDDISPILVVINAASARVLNESQQAGNPIVGPEALLIFRRITNQVDVDHQ